MKKYRNVVQDSNGNAIRSATITVTDYPSGTTSTIYSDNSGTSLSNPFTASSVDGAFEFYAPSGRYTTSIDATGYDIEGDQDISLEESITRGTKAEVQAMTFSQYHAGTKVFITSADGGAGTIRYDVGGGHSDDDPTYCGTKFIINSDPTIYWERDDVIEVDPRWYGSAIDGSTDDSTTLQACIDANKGGTIIIPEGDCLHAGILLDGSTYDNTKIICRGRLKLKPNTGGSSNFGGAWVGLIIKDCDGVVVEYKGDGNRTNMVTGSVPHLVGVAGASNLHFPVVNVKEVRGDGMYISQSNWTSSSTTPTNISIGDFKAYNSADDGRNALSVIAVDGLTIGSFHSDGVGGVVDTVRNPGGLDIEPNFGYQDCKNITVGSLFVRTVGTVGLALVGKAITDDATQDWCIDGVTIGSFVVERGNALTTALILRARNINVQGVVTSSLTNSGIAFAVDYATDINADLTLENADTLCALGQNGWVRRFNFNIVGNNYSTEGLRSIGVTDGRYTGNITGATSATDTYAIRTRSNTRGLTQENVTYSIDVPYDGNNARGFRNEPTDTVSYTECYISNCDMSGYPSYTSQNDAQIPSKNVIGRNYTNAQPANGAWVQGDFVSRNNTSTTDSNSLFILGWQRITTGTGNTAGTDWLTANVSHVSPIANSTGSGITAFATGGQASATQLQFRLNEISTVATTGDSVKLPTAATGLFVTVINNGANACDVFPSSGDNLGAGVDTAVSLASGSNITYAAYNATNWESV